MQDTWTTVNPKAGAVSARLPVLSGSRWAHLLILTLPFVAVIVGCHGLGHDFAGLQAGDEPIHYHIVETVIRQWPRPLLGSYGAWAGPLVYWLLATLSLPFHGSLEAVRLVVTAFSWGTCAIAYVLFRDRLHARPSDALALTLLLAVSPFFFGQSFHVLTDNPTWFFVVLALERLSAYVQRPAMARYAAFAVCLAAATTMRQITLWLLAPGLVALLSVSVSRRRRIACLCLLVLGVAPVVALLLYWGGPLPSGAAAATPLAVGHRMRNLLLSLGVVGWYGVLLIPVAELAGWWRRVREHPAWLAVIALPAVAAAALARGARVRLRFRVRLPRRAPALAASGGSQCVVVGPRSSRRGDHGGPALQAARGREESLVGQRARGRPRE